jgi:hypothetical protein
LTGQSLAIDQEKNRLHRNAECSFLPFSFLQYDGPGIVPLE